MRLTTGHVIVLAASLVLTAAGPARAQRYSDSLSYSSGQNLPGYSGQGSESWGRGTQLPGRGPSGASTSSSSSRPAGQAVMIKVEVTLTDQVGAQPPARKTLTLLAQDDNRAIIRTENRSKAGEHGTPGPGLSVEARPTLVSDGRIHLELSVMFDLPDSLGEGASGKLDDLPWTTRVQEGFGLLLENDKPVTVSQSADPRINRKVTVDVRATVLK